MPLAADGQRWSSPEELSVGRHESRKLLGLGPARLRVHQAMLPKDPGHTRVALKPVDHNRGACSSVTPEQATAAGRTFGDGPQSLAIGSLLESNSQRSHFNVAFAKQRVHYQLRESPQ